ncbi:MAG: preprotein translocase subunit SecY [Thaumarchaeota archaeon]|nr:preprotein translocase subunit SecY [Nitrososphaerota archaeon]
MSAVSKLVRNAATVLPEVAKPVRKPSFNEKLVWTGVALIIYFVMAQTPLFGVPTGLQDQLAYTRVIFASNQGTLMELGIGPIVTAGIIVQLLKGAQIIKLDLKKPEDRALYTSATKLLTIIVTLFEAAAFMAGGLFGRNVTLTVTAVILGQLVVTGIIVMLLDELVQKGWGLGSGISLFIMAGVAQKMLWDTFSIFETGQGPFGIIPYAIAAATRGDAGSAIFRAGGLPSIFGLVSTILLILAITFIEGVRIEIPITSTKYRGFSGVYPIKLMYVSVLPVILVSALIANINFFSQIISQRLNPDNSNMLMNWFATFNPANPGAGPTGGLLYFLTSPRDIGAAASEPIRTIMFIAFYVVFSIIFAKIWVEIGGLSPKEAAKGLIDANVMVPGFRRANISIESILERHIPALTIISGALIGLLGSAANLLGVFGSGTGILLAVGIIMNYYQILVKEHLETTMPKLAGLLGRA